MGPGIARATDRSDRTGNWSVEMLIDCQTCVARDIACRDCVVTVLLDRPSITIEPIELSDGEHAAIGILANAGLVPPLRLASGMSGDGREIA